MKHLSEQRHSAKTLKLALLATTAAVAATMGSTATAQADDSYAFRSPSGNIGCKMGTGGVMCQIKDYTWFIPRPLDYTMGGQGNRFLFDRVVHPSRVNGTRITNFPTAHRHSAMANRGLWVPSPATANLRA